jgi:hypothetical protein
MESEVRRDKDATVEGVMLVAESSSLGFSSNEWCAELITPSVPTCRDSPISGYWRQCGRRWAWRCMTSLRSSKCEMVPSHHFKPLIEVRCKRTRQTRWLT